MNVQGASYAFSTYNTVIYSIENERTYKVQGVLFQQTHTMHTCTQQYMHTIRLKCNERTISKPRLSSGDFK